MDAARAGCSNAQPPLPCQHHERTRRPYEAPQTESIVSIVAIILKLCIQNSPKRRKLQSAHQRPLRRRCRFPKSRRDRPARIPAASSSPMRAVWMSAFPRISWSTHGVPASPNMLGSDPGISWSLEMVLWPARLEHFQSSGASTTKSLPERAASTDGRLACAFTQSRSGVPGGAPTGYDKPDLRGWRKPDLRRRSFRSKHHPIRKTHDLKLIRRRLGPENSQ